MNEQEQREDELVTEALRAVGVQVRSAQDLMHTRDPYPAAIPPLIEMLGRVKTYTLKEIIARSLGTREAKGKAEPTLLAEFEASLHDDSIEARSFRWAIANTLEIIGGKGDASSFMRLLRDPRGSNAHDMLILAAAKTKDRRFIPVLLEYLESGKLQGFAARGLGILRAKEAVPSLTLLASETKNSWVRREAIKALDRINKSVK